MNIIDSAVCLPTKGGRLWVDEWLDLMGEWGIVHAVIAPTDAFVAVDNEAGNEQTARLVEENPDELSGLAVANPWYGQRALRILDSAFDMGLIGLYLHPARQGFRLTDGILDPLIELCIARRRPIYACTGVPVCAEPFQLAELARRFPEATFVLGHMAWSDFCGYDVLPTAKQAPNIYLETSCSGPGIIRAAIDALGAGRLLCGSGYPRSRPMPERVNLERGELTPEELRMLTFESPRTLWGLTGVGDGSLP